MVGDGGLLTELKDSHYAISRHSPHYAIAGEGRVLNDELGASITGDFGHPGPDGPEQKRARFATIYTLPPKQLIQSPNWRRKWPARV